MMCRLNVLVGLSLLCFLAISGFRSAAQQAATSDLRQGNIILGVLEDFPGEYSGDSDFRAVRAIFEKSGDGWRSFPTKTKTYHDLDTLPLSYPKDMTWTIAFDGRNLGRITSQTPPHFSFYSETGIEHITSHGPIPSVGKKSIDFAGSMSDTPAFRPLVAVSQPNVSDPDQWKPARLSSPLIGSAREQFRNKFPNVSNCKNPEENILRPWNYQDNDIHVSEAYSSKNNWSLVELNLTGEACDGDQGQDAFHGQWYAIDPLGTMKFLGEDMWLVDAGDYDNSGGSAVLFAISGYNEGGYRLFYRDFTRSAEFLFNYH